MTKLLLELSVLLLALGRILDFALRDKELTRYRLAYRFLVFEEWLSKSPWGKIQVCTVRALLRLHQRLFGHRLISIRYPLMVSLTSCALTVGALLLSMWIMPEEELVQAGFEDPSTPYIETVTELFVETYDKTQSLVPAVMVNAVFDFIALTVSYLVLLSLSRAGGAVKLLLLTSFDCLLSLLLIVLTQLAMIVFQYAGFLDNMINGRPTTFLLTSGTSLLLVSCTVALPVLLYSLFLAFLGLLRLSFKSVAFVTGRLADTSSSVFTDVAAFGSSVMMFFLAVVKIGAVVMRLCVWALVMWGPPTLVQTAFAFFGFWLELADAAETYRGG